MPINQNAKRVDGQATYCEVFQGRKKDQFWWQIPGQSMSKIRKLQKPKGTHTSNYSCYWAFTPATPPHGFGEYVDTRSYPIENVRRYFSWNIIGTPTANQQLVSSNSGKASTKNKRHFPKKPYPTWTKESSHHYTTPRCPLLTSWEPCYYSGPDYSCEPYKPKFYDQRSVNFTTNPSETPEKLVTMNLPKTLTCLQISPTSKAWLN